MEYSTSESTDELAQCVWASHILSYLNPYTSAASDDILQPHDRGLNGDDEEEFDEGVDDDNDDDDAMSMAMQTVILGDEALRQKSLDCISELLAHTKGGRYVTAAALREREDSVVVDVARNGAFDANDERYLNSLAGFLAIQDDAIPRQVRTKHTHAFVEETIDYLANRVIYWVERITGLFRGALYRPLHSSPVAGLSEERVCIFDCCSEPQISASEAVKKLVQYFLDFDFWQPSVSSRVQNEASRREIVELAAVAVRSPQETQSQLTALVPTVDTQKIMKAWRALARPVTDLQILSRISRLLPNFRSVSFVKFTQPAPIRLQRHQILTIKKAWDYLGLELTHFPPSLARKNSQFKSECSRSLPSHCEMQLLMRYEAEPSLVPSLAYFGCSKKACFLCDSFLARSQLKPRVRGRHGTCHPLWGVQPCDSETTGLILKEIREVLKQKIKAQLGPGPSSPTRPLQQSSAVSELQSADMFELRRQSENRNIIDRLSQEYRAKMQILLDPRSVGPREIWYRDLRRLCIMCQTPFSKRCTRCLASWYCSKRCQELDWPAHKLLCSQYLRFLETRPSSIDRLGIWFPRDTEKPKLVWAPIEQTEGDFHIPVFDSFLGRNHGVFFTLPFAENKRRGLELDDQLTIYYRDWDMDNNKSIYRTVEACHGMTVPNNMVGDYVVMHGQPHSPASKSRDMTLADFRHVLDFWSTYWDTTVREMPSGGSIVAVKISCPLEQMLYGRETFTSVAVDRDFARASEVSALSQVLGTPLWVCELERDELEREMESLGELPENGWYNPYAEILSTDIDPASKGWGQWKHTGQSGESISGNIILLRQDREDLDIEWARHMGEYCVEVLKPLFEKSLAGHIAPQDVLAEVTFEKMIAWKVAATPRKAAESVSKRGFVARIRN